VVATEDAMRALLVLSLTLTACVDLDRYRPLDHIVFAPLEQLLPVTHTTEPSTEERLGVIRATPLVI